jgi:presenilin-like A22 family membrane protease
MKHALNVTFILVGLFLITQIFGIFTVSKNIEVKKDAVTGVVTIEHRETIVGDPPKTESGYESVIILTIAILIGTLILLFFIRMKIFSLWKYWYLFAVVITMSITFGVYVKFFRGNVNNYIVLALAIALGWYKVHRNNVFIHNATEVFVYTGIAVLFVRMFEGWLWAAFLILAIISVYDMFAVWKSKHMVKIAKYQSESKIFAGLSIPYQLNGRYKGRLVKSQSERGIKTAVLGGGDLAFPLLFSGSVMSDLILKQGVEKTLAFFYTSIIAITAALALLYLLVKAEKNKFYPAMPFLSVGCIMGYFIILLLL